MSTGPGARRERSVRIVVLGRVGIERDGRLTPPSSGPARALLGALALAGLAGLTGLGDDALKALLWGARETMVSDSTLAVAVFRLRRWLDAAAGPGVEVLRTTGGYALGLPDAEVDAGLFRAEVDAARTLPAAERGEALERALALWRGRALEDVSPDSVDQGAVDRLERERVEAAVEHARAVLAAGAPGRALPRLAPLVRLHPLDEPLLGAWIEALAAAGRRAEALAAFAEVRARLRDQLGVDPGPALRDVHVRVLREEPPPDAGHAGRAERPGASARERARTAPETRPSQLPAAVPDFTGRGEQIDALLALLSSGRDGGPVAVPAVAGMGGIGKTALAVHTAHRARARFPGGQLFVDLRGAERDPAEPGEVLGRFLRALGVNAAAVPEGIAERAALYRSLLAERRVLVVLDNAADEDQVAPLLPGGLRSRALITSRTRLTALPGARLVELDVLAERQAVDLLTAIIGRDRVAAEPSAARDLARLCGHLPLALRVAGARLAAKAHWPIAGFAARMRGRRRLDELTQRGLSVRTTLDLGYRGLAPAARRLYRLLGLLDAPDVAGWVAGALLDAPGADGLELLEALVDAQLIDAAAGPAGVRYRFHDLVREHARELAGAEEPPEPRRAAVRRALGGWLALTDRVLLVITGGGDVLGAGAAVRYPPGAAPAGDAAAAPADWLEAERLALTAAVRQAARLGDHELSWELAVRASSLFQPASHADAWERVLGDAMPAVREAGDRRGEAALLERATELACVRRDYDEALSAVHEALRLFDETGERLGTALALRQLVVIHRMTGRFAGARREGERARALLRRVGDVAGEAHAVMVIGCAEYERGDPRAAVEVLTTARELARRARYIAVEAQSAYWIGQALLALGRPGDARPLFEHVGATADAAGSRLGDMYAAHGLGCTYVALGRPADAERSLRAALRMAEERGDRLMRARVLYVLGDLACDRGEARAAWDLLQDALGLATEVSVPLWRAKCLYLLGAVGESLGEGGAAGLRRRSLEIFAELGVPAGADSVAHLLW